MLRASTLSFTWASSLRFKQFFGTSQNAVKSQIWIAVSVYALVAIVRKQLGRCFEGQKVHCYHPE